MGEVRVNGANGPAVKSVEEMSGRFHAELVTLLPEWKARLEGDPACFQILECDVRVAFARGADYLCSGLLAMVMAQQKFADSTAATRREFGQPLLPGRQRSVQVRLLGGLVVWVTSLYCAARRSKDAAHQPPVPGIHVELAQFGFGKGCSPALESMVARKAVLDPSYQFASKELQRDGVTMDVKTVRRIATQTGERLLGLRAHDLDLWREGKLPVGTQLRGKRVSVQIDGGRTRMRGDWRPAPPTREKLDSEGLVIGDQPGRSRSRPKRTFKAEWREPKLVTIFVLDEQGRMEKKTQAIMDGTFEGPDAMAELIAMQLHRLGAAQALSVTFVADGATWIWDRIPLIVAKAQIKGVPVYEVLDNCHAAHHISLALASFGLSDQERMPLYRQHRTSLRNGHWRQVVDQLQELAELYPHNDKVHTEIEYLTKHGEAGRLKYPTFCSMGLPLGSGAIESSIRRVINLRLKGNGIFWKESNAEAILQVRAMVISNQWDERLKAMRLLELKHGRMDWRRTYQNMSHKTGAGDSIAT